MLALFNRHQLVRQRLRARARHARRGRGRSGASKLTATSFAWRRATGSSARRSTRCSSRLLEGWLGAALEIAPESRLALTSWHERRRAHVLAGRSELARRPRRPRRLALTRRCRRPLPNARSSVLGAMKAERHDDGTSRIPRARSAPSRGAVPLGVPADGQPLGRRGRRARSLRARLHASRDAAHARAAEELALQDRVPRIRRRRAPARALAGARNGRGLRRDALERRAEPRGARRSRARGAAPARARSRSSTASSARCSRCTSRATPSPSSKP